MNISLTKPPVAVVTGAARGLGRALACELCARGVHVVGIGRSLESLGPVTRALEEQSFLPLVADVTDPGAMAEAFDRIDAKLGLVSILVNNAAVYPHRDILDETPALFMETVSVNLGGAVTATHEALKRMVETGEGRIICVTSFAGLGPAPMAAAYSVSKDATRTFSRALHADLSDRFPGIVVLDWIPGALNTNMGIAEGHDPALAARWGASLALTAGRELNGTVFVENRQHLPPKSRKRRLFDRLLGRPIKPYVLPD